jgi:hypothetical protein
MTDQNDDHFLFHRAGLNSFTQKNSAHSQYWMRARVVAQGCTILAIALGSEFIKPNKAATYEEHMERTAASDVIEEKSWKG